MQARWIRCAMHTTAQSFSRRTSEYDIIHFSWQHGGSNSRHSNAIIWQTGCKTWKGSANPINKINTARADKRRRGKSVSSRDRYANLTCPRTLMTHFGSRQHAQRCLKCNFIAQVSRFSQLIVPTLELNGNDTDCKRYTVVLIAKNFSSSNSY